MHRSRSELRPRVKGRCSTTTVRGDSPCCGDCRVRRGFELSRSAMVSSTLGNLLQVKQIVKFVYRIVPPAYGARNDSPLGVRAAGSPIHDGGDGSAWQQVSPAMNEDPTIPIGGLGPTIQAGRGSAAV